MAPEDRPAMTRRRSWSLASVAIVMGALGALAALTGCGGPNRGAAYQQSLAEARRAHHAGRFDLAATRFDEAARTAKVPRDGVYARYEAACARARAGDVARASAELRAIASEKPPSAYAAQAAFKAADLAYQSDRDRGLAELEAVALAFPESGVAQVALQRVLRHDDESGAQASLDHLDRVLPRLKGTTLEETAAYERARRMAALGKTEAARDAFLAVAERFPYPFGAYNDDAFFRAAELEESLGRHVQAIALLERLLSQRESSSTLGSYERPRYVPALLRIAAIYEERLNDRARARDTLHRLYRDFTTSTQRDDALWREAELWRRDGEGGKACDRLATLAGDFPDSRYVPCAVDRCPGIKRPGKSKAPATCRAYLTRDPAATSTPPATPAASTP